jgi:hypothetical protein
MEDTEMKDWKLQIKEKLDQQDARRLVIHEAIFEKINHLKQFLGNRKVEFETPMDYSLKWQIKIGNTSFTIDDKDISEGQKLYEREDNNSLSEQKRDIKTVVEEIIVSKFLASTK